MDKTKRREIKRTGETGGGYLPDVWVGTSSKVKFIGGKGINRSL